jgi:hypothetical protein
LLGRRLNVFIGRRRLGTVPSDKTGDELRFLPQRLYDDGLDLATSARIILVEEPSNSPAVAVFMIEQCKEIVFPAFKFLKHWVDVTHLFRGMLVVELQQAIAGGLLLRAAQGIPLAGICSDRDGLCIHMPAFDEK